jgi:hypothetical protein
MGLTGWIKRRLECDPEERKFRKEARAEAKVIEDVAFHESYKEELLLAAAERGREKAKRITQKKKGSGGGLLNTLGNIGENMNKASKSLVAGIEINPDGNSGQNPFNVQDPLSPMGTYETDYHQRHKRKGNSLETVDPFDIE